MATYTCSCGEDARWYIQAKKMKAWHGREAIDPIDYADLAYACCEKHLPEAIRFVTQGMSSTLQVRPVNR